MEPYYQDESTTLYHADCRDVLEAVEADVVVTDPPYGETSLAWDKWQSDWLNLVPVNSMWCCGSLRMFLENASDFAGWKMSQDVIWKKHNGSNFQADRFRRIHEHALHFYKGKWAEIYKAVQVTMDAVSKTVRRRTQSSHTGAINAGEYRTQGGGPRMMTSVIDARSCHGSAVHPTQKPVALLGPLIEYGCPESGVVLDPFAGSGSTLIASRDLSRKSIGIEVNEKYCEAAAKRLEQKVLF